MHGYTGVAVLDGTCAFGHRPGPVFGDVPWGIAEIADHLGIKRASADQRRWRGDLPQPDGEMSGRPFWWRSTIIREGSMNERTRMTHDLAGAVRARLREAPGEWVPQTALLALAPEGRIVRVPELEGEEAFGADYAHGGAYDAGGTGKPDGGMLASALRIIADGLADTAQRLEESYPRTAAGTPGRSFRLAPRPPRAPGDVVILPPGITHSGKRAGLVTLDRGRDRWLARLLPPGAEEFHLAREWAEDSVLDATAPAAAGARTEENDR
jgi:hypothetical protein